MKWSEDPKQPPRELDFEENSFAEFVIERRYGIPGTAFIESLSPVERDDFVTEDMSLQRDIAFDALARLSSSALRNAYMQEKGGLDAEIAAYLTPCDDSELGRWLHADAWTPEEALALWLGARPRLPDLVQWITRNRRLDDRIGAAADRWNIIERAILIGRFNTLIEPASFAKWALTKPFPLRQSIRVFVEPAVGGIDPDEEIRRLGARIDALTSENNRLTKELDESDRPYSKIALQLFAAICIEKYNFSIEKSRNKATQEIADAIKNHFNEFSVVTVRNYIRMAIAALPKRHQVPFAEDEKGVVP